MTCDGVNEVYMSIHDLYDISGIVERLPDADPHPLKHFPCLPTTSLRYSNLSSSLAKNASLLLTPQSIFAVSSLPTASITTLSSFPKSILAISDSLPKCRINSGATLHQRIPKSRHASSTRTSYATVPPSASRAAISWSRRCAAGRVRA
jgi:hypothetical protein